MVLSIYITDQWISAVLLEENPIKVIDLTYVKIPYFTKLQDRAITKKFVINAIKSSVKKIPDNIIYIVDTTFPTDLKKNYNKEEILNQIPYTIVDINHFTDHVSTFISDKNKNTFYNYKEYKLNLPKDIKLQIDLTYFTYFINNNLDLLSKSKHLIIMSPLKYADIKILEYSVSIVKQFANIIKIPEIFSFNIDYAYTLIPLLAGLLSYNVDIKSFFNENPLDADAKLIVAPGVEKYEVISSTLRTRNNVKKTETVNLRANSINIISLKENEEMTIKYESKTVNFNKKIKGSRTDVYFDNRDFKQKLVK